MFLRAWYVHAIVEKEFEADDKGQKKARDTYAKWGQRLHRRTFEQRRELFHGFRTGAAAFCALTAHALLRLWLPRHVGTGCSVEKTGFAPVTPSPT